MELQKLQEISYMEYYHEIRDLSSEARTSLVQEMWTTIYDPCYKIKYDFFLEACNNPSELKIQVLNARHKSNNMLIGCCISFTYKLYHVENDEREENMYIVPFYFVCVSPQGRNIGTAKHLIDTLESFIIQEQGLVNIAHINYFASAFMYYHFSKRSKLAIPDSYGTVHVEAEKLMFNFLAICGVECTKPNDNPYVFKTNFIFNNDNDYLKKNYENLHRYLKYFIDLTNLEVGYVIASLHPVYLIEGNTLEFEAGNYVLETNIFRGEIRVIN